MVVDQVASPAPHENGNGVLDLHEGENGAPKEPKFASGLILPPPEIKCTYVSYFLLYPWSETCT